MSGFLFGRRSYAYDFDIGGAVYHNTWDQPPPLPSFQSIYNAEVQGWKLEWQIGSEDSNGNFGNYLK